MENKYYTPDISEFFVGFEYELKNPYSVEIEWDKKVVEDLFTEDNLLLYHLISTGNIRVKYLSQEDIESLGFTLINETSGYIQFDYTPASWYWLSWKEERVEIMNCNDPIFQGKIKNLSELKRILTMVGVI